MGRRTSSGDVSAETLPFPGTPAVDEVYQRLFVPDRSVIAWDQGQRILVFDIHPSRIRTGMKATAVIGAKDFESRQKGLGPNNMRGANVLADGENQRLFVADRGNNRVLVFDIHPERFHSNPDAIAVIGQADFTSRDGGLGRSRLRGPSAMVLDRRRQRLFVSDDGNGRILVFDAHSGRFRSNPNAIAVLGAPDFDTPGSPRRETAQIRPGSLSYDDVNDRLLVADVPNNRILAYDVAPERMTSLPRPVGVAGQPDLETIEDEILTYSPDHAQSKTLGPRISHQSFDNENQLLYVAEGYYAGNRIGIFDVSAEALSRRRGAKMVDVIGHLDDDGQPSYIRRSANDRVDARHHYPRSVALDPVDHRLFTIDQYNHRVLVWRLDPYNRLLGREAELVIGQPDFHSATIHPPTSRTFRLPGAVAYDVRHKRLFVADGWHNRVLVFDAQPARLRSFPEAIAALGQSDFTTVTSKMTRSSINFDVAEGRHGITSGNPRAAGLALDPQGDRLFVSDGPNYRVLIFDVSPEKLMSGAPAAGVIGKPDFTSGRSVLDQDRRQRDDPFGVGGSDPFERLEPKTVGTAIGFANMPGDLAFDPNHQRLFVIDGRSHRVLAFNVDPATFANGQEAIAVIGQPDFQSTAEVRLDTQQVQEGVGRSQLRWPDGIAYDALNDRLILSDKGNDRILFYEVAPGKLRNGMPAGSVIGQKDFVSREPGRGRQDEMMDARGLAFDSEQQRLYVTDSFWARLTVFDLARPDWHYRLAPGGLRSYASIDASTLEKQPRREGYTRLDPAKPVSAMALYSVTEKMFDGRSWRESRLVVSQAALPAPPESQRARVFVEQGAGQETTIVMVNPGAEPAEIRFRFRDEEGRERASPSSPGAIRLGPAEQLRVAASQLLGSPAKPVRGTVEVTSSAPLALSALRVTQNTRGEPILAAMPVVYGNPGPPRKAGQRIVVPKVVSGGGYRTRLILMNTGDEALRGTIEYFTASGIPAPAGKQDYEIAPRGCAVHETEPSSSLPRRGYAVVSPAEAAPEVAALLTLADGELVISQSRTDAPSATRQAWIAVDTRPTPVRHGRIEAQVAIVNNNPVPASLRFILYGPGGEETKRHELILPNGQQGEFTLTGLFDVAHSYGTLRVVSEPAVHISAEQGVLNLRDELVSTQIPVFTTEPMGDVVPHFADGAGMATEVFLLNTGKSELTGRLSHRGPRGEALSLPLR